MFVPGLLFQGYEAREYHCSSWVVTSYRATDAEDRALEWTRAFMRLLAYIQRENEDGRLQVSIYSLFVFSIML